MKEIKVISDPTSGVSESIKGVRTNLLFSSVDNAMKSLLITSSVPSEGKSYVASNLAVSFTQIGKKVLLIDGDMRRGRTHEIFKISNLLGLSALLIDEKDKYSDYIIKSEIANLDIIPSGFYPPNPSDMLSSKKFEKLIRDMEKKYDLVIIDGTPLQMLPDALEISKVVNKIILMCALNETPKDTLVESKKALEKFGNKLAGIVINKVNKKTEKYYYRYEKEKV